MESSRSIQSIVRGFNVLSMNKLMVWLLENNVQAPSLISKVFFTLELLMEDIELTCNHSLKLVSLESYVD